MGAGEIQVRLGQQVDLAGDERVGAGLGVLDREEVDLVQHRPATEVVLEGQEPAAARRSERVELERARANAGMGDLG